MSHLLDFIGNVYFTYQIFPDTPTDLKGNINRLRHSIKTGIKNSLSLQRKDS
ncbi:hypothetical protein [Dactylococcopsis salina]|uniref:hypothetical protein n=1 Tax=Dactylococcopsis salina TaxID=292566 RepID=UPI0002E57AEC|nr:hypothetical protein [Dactylococcopsis salina]